MALLQIRFTKSGVANIGRRELQAVGRLAIGAAARHWQVKFLPIHFTTRARARYRYRPREGEPGSGHRFKGSYAWRKVQRGKIGDRRAIGENKPFVFSGESRRSALSNSRVVAKATNFNNYWAEVRIPAPAINFVEGGPSELTRTTKAEEDELERVFEHQYERGLQRRGRTYSRRIAA